MPGGNRINVPPPGKVQIIGVVDLVDVTGEVEYLVGEAPLVIIPGNELDEVAVKGDTGSGIEDGGVGITKVGVDNVVIHILQNTLHRALGSGLHGSADFVIGRLLDTGGHVNNWK